MDKNFHTTAILLMAGGGQRLGSSTPKQFTPLLGKELFLYSLETFIASSYFEEIILVCPSTWVDKTKKLTARIPSNIRIIPGGKTRQESSYEGICACSCSTHFVTIHDAARPFVTKKIIEENLTKAFSQKAAVTAIEMIDTLTLSPDKKKATHFPNRSECYALQTPQSFSYPLIKKAHKEFLQNPHLSLTDDSRLLVETGHPVYLSPGSRENFKVTTPLDLLLAEALLFKKKELSLQS